jgi:hypothetical protein
MAVTSPPIHHWFAGDPVSAERMNEIKASIDWLRNPPLLHLQRTGSSIALAVTTWTSIPFDTVLADNYDMWDAGTPDTVTVTVPGWYTVEGVLRFQNTAVDSRLTLGVWKQAGTELILRYDQQGLDGTGGDINMRKESTMFLNVGDTITLEAHTNAGARNLVVGTNGECPTLKMRWVSD